MGVGKPGEDPPALGPGELFDELLGSLDRVVEPHQRLPPEREFFIDNLLVRTHLIIACRHPPLIHQTRKFSVSHPGQLPPLIPRKR